MYDISSYSVFMSYSAKIVVCVECLWHACLRGAFFCCLVNDKCEPWPYPHIKVVVVVVMASQSLIQSHLCVSCVCVLLYFYTSKTSYFLQNSNQLDHAICFKFISF